MTPGLRQTVARALRRVPGVRELLAAARPTAPVATPAEAAAFHDSGFMVFDPGLPEAVLDRAVGDLSLFADELSAPGPGKRVFDGWKRSRAVRAIALAPRVHRLLAQLYGRRPLPFQTLNFPVGTEQAVHSDVIHFASDPPTYMCGVWVALEDIDMQNGPLVYYPGSHKRRVIAMEDVAPGPGSEHYHLYEAHVGRLVRDEGLVPHHAVLRKGQALVWASNLLHGGSVHRDKGRTRHSQVTHYFFEGCQYYSPLASYGGYRFLRQPEWVR